MNKKKIRVFFLTVLSVSVFFFCVYARQQEELAEFLKPAHFIDSDNPKIVQKVETLTADCRTDAEKARVLFEFVRDSYNSNHCQGFKASEVLECGGNSCRQRSILLAALCRAVRIPARLHLQKVTIKDWKREDGKREDITFAHGITGIYLNGAWHLYEPVGNKDKWLIWTQDERRASEMPLPFYPDRDCLFKPETKIIIENLPVYFADRSKEMIELIEKIDTIK